MLYEVITVPVGILGALLAAKIFGQSNDVYFKVGLLTTIGLAARNAILIVEFAQKLQEDGMEMLSAIALAAHQRLRPILMTTRITSYNVCYTKLLRISAKPSSETIEWTAL